MPLSKCSRLRHLEYTHKTKSNALLVYTLLPSRIFIRYGPVLGIKLASGHYTCGWAQSRSSAPIARKRFIVVTKNAIWAAGRLADQRFWRISIDSWIHTMSCFALLLVCDVSRFHDHVPPVNDNFNSTFKESVLVAW